MAPPPSPTADVLFLITATLIGLLLKANVNNNDCCDKNSSSRLSVSVTLGLSKRKVLNDAIDDDEIIVCLFVSLSNTCTGQVNPARLVFCFGIITE